MADCKERHHVHVDGNDGEAKFWLKPVSLARERGLQSSRNPSHQENRGGPSIASDRRNRSNLRPSTTMTPPIIKAVRTVNDRLVFELDGDRQMSLPMTSSSRLANATAAERDHWIIGARGVSVHWPDVDEDIAIWEVLGIQEDAYLRALREAPVG
jgi:hypothetical protein